MGGKQVSKARTRSRRMNVQGRVASVGAVAVAGLAIALVATPPIAAQTGLCPCAEPPIYASQMHNFRVVTIAEGFETPWSVAFLPDGGILVTEKAGRLRVIRDGVLDPNPIEGTPEVRYQGQGGLMEVALHPDFPSNGILYLSYSKPNEEGNQATTALARARFDGTRLHDLEDIFIAEAWSGGGAHFGGKIAFDPDGYLFLSIGDRGGNPFIEPRSDHPSQSLLNHQGTIVRLHDDGRVPEDNPFAGRSDALPEIWSYGHRNPQGLVIDQESGEIWSTEHGPQGGDELNLVLPGRNYGWPVIGYGVQYRGTPIHEARERDGMEQPIQYWTPSIATSGLVLYRGDRFTGWRNQLLVGGLDGRQIARVQILRTDEGEYRVGGLERPGLMINFGRVRDLREGPDGFIYVVIDDRGPNARNPLVRLEPVEEG